MITATGHAELAALDLRNARGTRQTRFTDGRVDTGSGGARAFTLLTLPLNDSDGDGLDDKVESGTGLYLDESDRGTNPNHFDSDGDGLNDNFEVPSQATLGPDQPDPPSHAGQ